jgi:mediator of replication checkpoint protein 1
MFGIPAKPVPASPPPPQTVQTLPPTPVVRDLASDDDEELPPVHHLLEGHNAAKQAEEQRNQLMEMKMRLIAQQPHRETDDSDDDLQVVDNNMQVVADEEAEQRKAMKMNHVRVSEGRKIQMMHGRAIKKAAGKVELSLAMPAFRHSGKGKREDRCTQESLIQTLLQRVEVENKTLTRKREEEWVARGGKAFQKIEDEGDSTGLEGAYVSYAEMAVSGKCKQTGEPVKDEDDSDGEWMPEEEEVTGSGEPGVLMGSASPEPGSMSETETSDEESQNQDSDDEMDDKETFRLRGARRPRAVVDSDDESFSIPLAGKILVPDTSFVDENSAISPLRLRGSISSFGTSDETENENDKENDTRRMWDKSEDKENKAVVRHTLFGPRPPLGREDSLLGLEGGLSRALSMSPRLISDDDNENTGGKSRTPFKELPKCTEDHDPFLSPQITKSTFTQRLVSASHPPSPTLVPVLGRGTPAMFSQFYDDHESYGADENDENLSFKPKALERGFKQLRSPGTDIADSTLKEDDFGSPFSDNKVRLPQQVIHLLMDLLLLNSLSNFVHL